MNIIYYYTGTGNTYYIAKQIADGIGDYELINISNALEAESVEAERIGFVFPVYYGGLPRIAHEFMSKLRIKGEPYLFSVVTAGGATGVIHNQVDDYLKKKSKTLGSGFSLIMPDNYVIMYDAPEETAAMELIEKAKKKTAYLAELILEKKSQPFEDIGGFMFNLVSSPLNRWFIYGVQKKDKKFTVDDTCIGCGKCVNSCSVKNIQLQNKKPIWEHRCEQCLACIHICPLKSINYGNGTRKRGRYHMPVDIHN